MLKKEGWGEGEVTQTNYTKVKRPTTGVKDFSLDAKKTDQHHSRKEWGKKEQKHKKEKLMKNLGRELKGSCVKKEK